jgi:ABC-type branched-subunit amino acid transport system substrate-binding protein
MARSKLVLAGAVLWLLFPLVTEGFAKQDIVKIALNYPQTGPYAKEGKDQWYAAEIARKEINDAGGILGKRVVYRWSDSASNPNKTKANLTAAIKRDKVKMAFGGSSSAVAIVAGEICRKNNILFFGTLTYSTATTGKAGHRHLFRECYNSWMGAKAVGSYLRKKHRNAKYFYITADYTWGWTTESSFRTFTGTSDKDAHPGVLTPFPSGFYDDALEKAKAAKADVLVLVLFGQEMATAIRRADEMGLKNEMQIVVPNLTLTMAERGTPKAMAGVIGALPWCWKVPYQYNYQRGIDFVEKFKKRFNRYPSTSAASAYTIMHEYKAAVERAGTFNTNAVIKALEGHEYQILKDRQVWRRFDHQSVQTVYTVKCNPIEVVLKDKYNLDYFTIIGSLPGTMAARTRAEWNAVRKAAGKPTYLQ